MDYMSFLAEIIRRGIDACVADYHRPDQENKRDGSVRGFNDCRGLWPDGLVALYAEANQRAQEAHGDDKEDYWYWRCRALEIEWVCNVVSAGLRIQLLGPLPTMRGCLMAADIVGVANV